MADILQLRVHPEELEQLRLCQTKPRSDGKAAFTVTGPGTIWPGEVVGDTPVEGRVNLRGWFPLLDEIADEFLIWKPAGGAIVVSHEGARYCVEDCEKPGVEFLEFELSRPVMVARQHVVEIPRTGSGR